MDSVSSKRKPVVRLTVSERVELVELFFSSGKNHSRAVNLFNERHRDRAPITRMTLKKLMKKFQSTGAVTDVKPPGRPRSATSDVAVYDVLRNIERSPRKGIRCIAQECHTSHASVLRILKRHSYRPYKERRLQELRCTDPDRRLNFCSLFVDHVNV